MSRNLRDYARRTNVRLGVGAFLLLFIVGLGLVYLIYGQEAAMMGFLCLMLALVPIGLIVLFFIVFDWIMKRAGRE